MTSKQHTAVRVDDQTLARIEALRQIFSTTWRDATISDILRALIYSGLKVLEKEHAGELKKQRKLKTTVGKHP